MPDVLTVPALRTYQGSVPVYALFLRGADLLRIADIRRLTRGKRNNLQGFQRKGIKEHVNEIARYLDDGGTLFPNAIILALEPKSVFKCSRGTKGRVARGVANAGHLSLPVHPEGERVAWIVDGQQRSLALRKSKERNLVVPIVAFETASLQTQREQFILVNRAKPLPQRLIDELLPATNGTLLPRELKARQVPSRLCDALNTHENSPLRGMIRRASQPAEAGRVVTDTAILEMIRRSLSNPNGALAGHKSLGDHPSDVNGMLVTLIDFWAAVKRAFPKAWGKPPSESRLMHSAGIAALGDLMDRIAARATSRNGLRVFFARELSRLAPDCAWTDGTWPRINRAWDDFQTTSRDIRLLSQILVQLYAERTRR